MEIDNYITPEDETILLRDGKEKITTQRLFDVVKDCSSFIDKTTESEEHPSGKACAYVFVLSRILRVLHTYMEDNSNWRKPGNRLSVSLATSTNNLKITEEIKDYLRRGVQVEATLDLNEIIIDSPLRPTLLNGVKKFNKTVLTPFAKNNPSCFTMFMYFNDCYNMLESVKKALIELDKTIDWEK